MYTEKDDLDEDVDFDADYLAHCYNEEQNPKYQNIKSNQPYKVKLMIKRELYLVKNCSVNKR